MDTSFHNIKADSYEVTRVNKLVKNTYITIGIGIMLSAISSYFTLNVNISLFPLILMLASMFGLIFAISHFKNSAIGLFLFFAFTALMGAFVGPAIGLYLDLPNGKNIVTMAFTMTTFVFISLSCYVHISKKEFSFIGGFLFTGLILLIVAMILNIFFYHPVFHLVISCVAVLVFSGFILYDTSRMVHEHNGNYIELALSQFLNIFNLFIHLLSILGILSDDWLRKIKGVYLKHPALKKAGWFFKIPY